MKALVLEADKVLKYVDVPLPEKPAEDWLLLRIAYAGICNSDIRRGFGGGAYHYPLIMGHEAAGVIEEVSKEVEGWKTGQRITFDSTIYCGRCWHCRRGEISL